MTPLLAAVLLTLALVAADAWLLHVEGAREILTPGPRRVAQNFMGALSARRPAIAHEHVADAARGDLSRARLQEVASRLRAQHGSFRFVGATEGERQGDRSTVRTTLRTGDHGTVELILRLTRDPATQLWKVTSM